MQMLEVNVRYMNKKYKTIVDLVESNLVAQKDN